MFMFRITIVRLYHLKAVILYLNIEIHFPQKLDCFPSIAYTRF